MDRMFIRSDDLHRANSANDFAIKSSLRIVLFVIFPMMYFLCLSCHAELPDELLNIYSKNYSTRHGLPSNSISAITQDYQGRIWVCTQRGVASYDGHDFIAYQHKDHQNVSTYCNSIFFDSQKRIWIGTTAGVATITDGSIVQLAYELGRQDAFYSGYSRRRSG